MGKSSKRPPEFAPQPRWRVAAGPRIAVGPGKIDLLAHIGRTGSISQAALEMEMSYMRAWSLIKTMNQCFQSPLVVTERGGSQRGGAALTPTGRRVVTLYRQMELASRRAVQPQWRAMRQLLQA